MPLIQGMHKIKGYELKFYFDDEHSSCIQIFTEQNEPHVNFKVGFIKQEKIILTKKKKLNKDKISQK